MATGLACNVLHLMTSALVLVLAANAVSAAAPWWRGPSPEGKAYMIPNIKLNQAAALSYCQSQGGWLTRVSSTAENNYIMDFINDKSQGTTWLDYTDKTVEGTFVDADGTAPAFTNWDGGEPNNKNEEDCCTLKTNFKWNDKKCSGTFKFVCQYYVIWHGPDANGNLWYQVPGSWFGRDQSEAECQSRIGGTLPIVQSLADVQFMFDGGGDVMEPGKGIWLDYRDTGGSWLDHNGNPPAVTNWRPAFPTGMGTCAAAFWTLDSVPYAWDDVNCADENLLICMCPRCDPPAAIGNGTLVSPQPIYIRDDQATMTCNTGYTMVGSPTGTCLCSGKWTPWPTCVRNCIPPTIPNGYVVAVQAEYVPDDTITVACGPGYLLTGDTTLTCVTFTSWDATTFPTCALPPKCIPPTIPNGSVVGAQADYNVGEVITVSCDPGYVLSGDATLDCLVSEAWDATPFPSCALPPKCIPPTIPNGSVVAVQADYDVGEVITVSCDPGYVLSGDATLDCLVSETWDATPFPSCALPPKCTPPTVANGVVISIQPDYDPGDVITISCSAGYDLYGSATSTCLVTEIWDAVATCANSPRCIAPSVGNGSVIDLQPDYAPGQSINVTCDADYDLFGDAILTCQMSTFWNYTTFPTCVLSPRCIAPSVGNGSVVGLQPDYAPGQTINVTCDADYDLFGDAILICQTSTSWNYTTFPTCVLRPLCLPPTIPNASVVTVQPQYNVGEVITVACDAGYNLSGDATLTCLASETWDATPFPNCTLLKCIPPTLTDGFVITVQVDYSPGDVIAVDCNPGFNLHGDSTLTCLVTEEWDASPFPNCTTAPPCDAPNIQNGYVVNAQPDYRTSDNATVACNAGFDLTGSSVIVCLDNSTWSAAAFPKCSRRTCPGFSLYGGSTTIPNTPENNSQTLACNASYSPIPAGDRVITCTNETTAALWNDLTGFCGSDSQRCTRATPNNGATNSTDHTEQTGHVIGHSCAGGYYLEGSDSQVCGAASVWDYPVPGCAKVTCVTITAPTTGGSVTFSAVDLVPGVTASLTCPSGRRPRVSAVATCLASGQWSHHLQCGLKRTCQLRIYGGCWSPVMAVFAVATAGLVLAYLTLGLYWWKYLDDELE